MSDGMTDKRSQPDEGVMAEWTAAYETASREAMKQLSAAERARMDAANKTHDGRRDMGLAGVNMPEGWFKPIGPLPDRRAQALEMAMKTFPDAGDHPDVTTAMLARADAFLAWLEGKGGTAEAVEPERAPGEPERTPAEMAEVGDVVEIIGLSRAVDGARLVLSKDSRSLDEKLRVKCDGFAAWVHDRHVKRIVHKADEAAR